MITKELEVAGKLADALTQQGCHVIEATVTGFENAETKTVSGTEIRAGRYAKVALTLYVPVEADHRPVELESLCRP